MEQQRYKLTDAARILGVSHWTLRRMVHKGTVPVIKTPSGRFYISLAWIQAQLQQTKEG